MVKMRVSDNRRMSALIKSRFLDGLLTDVDGLPLCTFPSQTSCETNDAGTTDIDKILKKLYKTKDIKLYCKLTVPMMEMRRSNTTFDLLFAQLYDDRYICLFFHSYWFYITILLSFSPAKCSVQKDMDDTLFSFSQYQD